MRPAITFLLLLLAGQARSQQANDSVFQRVTRILHYTIDSGNVVYHDTTIYKYSGERSQKFSIFNFYPGSRYGYSNSNYFGMLLASPVADIPDPLWDIYSFPVTSDSIFRNALTNNAYGGTGILVRDTIFSEFADSTIVSGETRGYHRYRFEYDERKRLSNIELHQSFDRIYWGLVRWRKIVYGQNGKPASDTSLSVNAPAINTMSTYEYDSLDRITSCILFAWRDAKWSPIRIYHYSYNQAGQLETAITRQSYANFDTTERKEMKYDNLGRLTSYIDMGTEFGLHYNEKNEVDTLIIGNCYKVAFCYNSFHNPDSAHSFVLNACRTLPGMHRTLYTYEEVKRDPSIDKTKGIVIYPNPAQDQINIAWNNKIPDGPVTVTIFNTLRMQVSRSFIVSPAVVDSLDVGSLASGVYIIVIQNNASHLHTGKIVIL